MTGLLCGEFVPELNEYFVVGGEVVIGTRNAGLGSATPLLQEIIRQTPIAIENVARQTPSKFPSEVRDKIFEGLQRSAMQLANEL